MNNNPTKEEIRNRINKIRKKMPKETISEKSGKITNTLTNLEEYARSDTVMFYISLDFEVDTKELIKEELLKKDKTLIIPYLEENTINIYKLENFSSLKKGNYGILEPIKKEKFNDKIDLIIVPGVAFDKNGTRLGFGKAYYDEFLKDHKESIKIGLAFEEQIIDHIPIEPHDKSVDMIITDKRIIRCK